jgi:hypothetical protein
MSFIHSAVIVYWLSGISKEDLKKKEETEKEKEKDKDKRVEFKLQDLKGILFV